MTRREKLAKNINRLQQREGLSNKEFSDRLEDAGYEFKFLPEQISSATPDEDDLEAIAEALNATVEELFI